MQKPTLKIAFVTHSYPLKSDPSKALFVKNEAHLLSQEHDVEIHLPSVFAFPFQTQYRRMDEPLEYDLPIHKSTYLSVPKRKLSSFTGAWLSYSLLKTIENQKPDVVHLHSLYPTGLAAKSVKQKGYPVVLTIHGGDWYYNLTHPRLMSKLIDMLNYCDKIVCVGQNLLYDIANHLPSISDKLVHIPHGIDTDIFHPQQTSTGSKNKLHWDPELIQILAVGNLFRVKGYDILLRAFAEIASQELYRLHIVAPRSDDDAKKEIEQLMASLNLQDRVTFYGQKSPEELADFYRASDLLVSSSRKEGFGLVVAEALACGTPVVATRSGGPEEIVTKETGLLITPENPGELISALKDIITVKDRYDPNTLHRYISENFSVSSKREKLNVIYRELSDQHNKI